MAAPASLPRAASGSRRRRRNPLASQPASPPRKRPAADGRPPDGGMRVFSCGKLTLYPRRSWERFLLRSGGGLSKRIQDAELVVIGGGAAAWPEARLGAARERAER